MQPSGDALRCPFCLTLRVPAAGDDDIRILAEDPHAACPVCHTSLQSATLTSIAVLYCPTCRGMAVAMPNFENLIDNLRAQPAPNLTPIAEPDLDRRAICPNCRRLMDTHFYAGGGRVVIDTCESCSLNWLDYNEANRIAHHADSLAVNPFAPARRIYF